MYNQALRNTKIKVNLCFYNIIREIEGEKYEI